MKKQIVRFVNEYRSKIADCDKILESLRFEKNGLRDKRRSKDDAEASNAEHELHRVRKEEAFKEIQRQCFVQAMHDFDSLLDLDFNS